MTADESCGGTGRALIHPDRRGCVAMLAAGVLGLGILVPLRPAAAAPVIDPADDRLRAASITLPGASGPLAAYYVRPAEMSGPAPAVLLLHESRGRTEHIEDVARRLALAGYLVLAPDLLSPAGGTPAEAEEAREAAGALPSDQVTADAVAALVWLKGREEGSGKVGAVGFAWGGAVAGRLAVVAPALDAAVIFYGKPPPVKDVEQIRTPLLFHHAALDERLEAVPAFEEAARAAGVPLESHSYAGVQPSFLNDTVASRFDAPMAELAWERTLAFLRARLA